MLLYFLSLATPPHRPPQPQSTHMDLNIGCAFWFASRGRGYTRHYSTAELGSGYEVVQDGRPLLRRGGEGHARGRGEKVPLPPPRQHQPLEEEEESSKRKETKLIETQENQTESTVYDSTNSKAKEGDFATEEMLSDSVLKAALSDGSEGKGKGERLACSQVACCQISKPGCLHDLCKRCCVKRFKTETAALHARPGVDHASSVPQCPVHKQKKKNNSARDATSEAPFPKTTSTHDEEDVSQSESQSESQSQSESKSQTSAQTIPHQSVCKVLVVGIGADEQLAGYSRHRTVFQRAGEVEGGGLSALAEELKMDTARIYNRNLGR